MKTSNYHLNEERRLQFITELIADDLKIHKHFHILSQSGLDSSLLQLNLHDKIFTLVGIDEQKIDDSLRDWYFRMCEKVYEVDVFRDEEKLLNLATEILVALNKKQFE